MQKIFQFVKKEIVLCTLTPNKQQYSSTIILIGDSLHFEVDGEDYIALMPLDENDQDNAEGIVYFYGYSEDEQGLAQLRYIDSEDEYEAVLDRFDELQDEAFYDSIED